MGRRARLSSGYCAAVCGLGAQGAAGTHYEAPRSELVGVLLTQADRPASATLPAFDAFSFVEHEMGAAHGSTLAHLLDKSGAFDKTYTGLTVEYCTYDRH